MIMTITVTIQVKGSMKGEKNEQLIALPSKSMQIHKKVKKNHVLCILDTIKIDKDNILGNVATLKLDRVAI